MQELERNSGQVGLVAFLVIAGIIAAVYFYNRGRLAQAMEAKFQETPSMTMAHQVMAYERLEASAIHHEVQRLRSEGQSVYAASLESDGFKHLAHLSQLRERFITEVTQRPAERQNLMWRFKEAIESDCLAFDTTHKSVSGVRTRISM